MDIDSINSSLEDVLANFDWEEVSSMAKNPAVMGFLVLAAQILQFILPPAANLAAEEISERVGIRYVPPLLESDANCGMTTGGQVHKALFNWCRKDFYHTFHCCLPFNAVTLSGGVLVGL